MHRLIRMLIAVQLVLIASPLYAQTVDEVEPEEAAAAWAEALHLCLLADAGEPLPACRRGLTEADAITSAFGEIRAISGGPLPAPLPALAAIHAAVGQSVSRLRVRTLVREALEGWVVKLLGPGVLARR